MFQPWNRRKRGELNFTVGEKTGIARINITATGGGETATYTMEIEVRSPNPPETRAELKVLQKVKNGKTSFTPFGIEGSNSANLEVSSLPSINLDKRLDYLVIIPMAVRSRSHRLPSLNCG